MFQTIEFDLTGDWERCVLLVPLDWEKSHSGDRNMWVINEISGRCGWCMEIMGDVGDVGDVVKQVGDEVGDVGDVGDVRDWVMNEISGDFSETVEDWVMYEIGWVMQ
ncbi:hypothetical protein DPMN_167844 [Dreissena polymorpha]|uniref:Uncharacterized protein n=1 Tax=Dreissena polymorpha TaxID=45954 RepID=A0A9D4F259_DREPO|nr:hypothetical protein DPMN_167844 [Dreissena polymorpha]